MGLSRGAVRNLIDGFLMNRILLIGRADEYRLWEGSDFDTGSFEEEGAPTVDR